MRTIRRKLNIVPGGIPVLIKLNQYDSDYSLVFELYSTDGVFTVPSGSTAEIRGTKQSCTGYSASATLDTSTKVVTVAGAAQMTAVAGMNIYEIVLKKDNKEISSENFCLLVERAALDADTITDESVLRELNAIIEGADTATQAAEEAEDAADRAEAAAQTLVTDSTLTHSGQAADAKATGDALTQIEDEIAQIVPGFSSEAKDALLACFRHVAWTDEHGQDYYDALESALYPETGSIIHLKGYAYGQTSSGNIQLGGGNTRACSVYASGDNPIPKASTAELLQGDYYPIPIPQGSSSVSVSMPNDLYVGIRVISWNGTAYSSDYSSPWLSANDATVDVSSYSDGEHFVAFTYKSGSAGTTDMTNYDMSSVSITFS